jgi:hypothetical protein
LPLNAKLKHLEFIQNVISRMAQNSFLFKGWAITIAAGLSAFAASSTRHGLIGIALSSTIIFWGLDAYYLWLERCFIQLYETVASKPESDIDFRMSIDKSHPVRSWLRTWFRPHNVMFYGAILLVELIAIFLIKGGHGGEARFFQL